VSATTDDFRLQPGPLGPAAIAALCLAVGVAAALGFASLMYFLVHSSELRLAEKTTTQLLDFVRVKRNETARRKDRTPERPQVQDVPDTPPLSSSSAESGSQLEVAFAAPDLAAGGPEFGREMGLGRGSGDFLPIVKVAPIYPRRALLQNITGTCMVTYTVTTAGTVKDVSVVDEECEHDIFRRPSVDAAERFRYKPRVIDGVPIEVRGVRNIFYYTAEQAPDVDTGAGP
jgi:protein TonB